MSSEIKTCQNCKTQFTIEPEDFLFYEKINVPSPTFCPNCRLQRRLAFNNTFQLYKRPCDLCGKEVISRYSKDKKYKVYCPLCWWGDGWDGLEYGREYDFSKSFFQQFSDLWHEVPLLGLSVDLQTAKESPYINDAGYCKQCYLIFNADTNERCAYGYFIVRSQDCVDSTAIFECELLHDSFHGEKNYHGTHLYWTTQTNNSAFLLNSNNCQNCFASANLRNKQHVIFNQQYTKEKYAEKMKEYDLGSYAVYQKVKADARAHWRRFPVRSTWLEFSQNSSGILVFSSRNCKCCFSVEGVEDSKYVSYMTAAPVKDCYDYSGWGKNAELIYEGSIVGENARNIKFGEETGMGIYDSQYIKLGIEASNQFGCVSLRNKSYCILNKQYTEDEYKALVPRIIEHMNEIPYRDSRGREYRYGEFFPIELSPFGYNETLAGVYDPLTNEQTLREGYSWKDEEKNEYAISIKAADLPDHIKDVQDSILKEVIGCKACGRGFSLIPQELVFYRKMNVPLPRECFYCRLKEKMDQQPHPLKWFRRTCQCIGKGSDNGIYENAVSHVHGNGHCQNEFDTWYAPERPETIYCDDCFKTEVI